MTQLSELTAVVLAGGAGTRLLSVVSDRPKSMALVHGRPFLSFLLDELASFGIRRVVISTGYMAEIVESHFGAAYGPIQLAYSRETTPLGTGGALRLALPLLNSNPVLALNGDSFCKADLKRFLAEDFTRHAAASLLTVRVNDVSRYGQVHSDAAGRVTGFAEKGQSTGEGWINAGIYLLGREFLESIPPGSPVSLEKETIPSFIGRGLYASPLGQRFLDIGTPQSYAEAEKFFAPT